MCGSSTQHTVSSMPGCALSCQTAETRLGPDRSGDGEKKRFQGRGQLEKTTRCSRGSKGCWWDAITSVHGACGRASPSWACLSQTGKSEAWLGKTGLGSQTHRSGPYARIGKEPMKAWKHSFCSVSVAFWENSMKKHKFFRGDGFLSFSKDLRRSSTHIFLVGCKVCYGLFQEARAKE